MTCWRCAAPQRPGGRVGRRDACQQCGADLHCCRNCRFYDVGRQNHCREPLAERQVEKAKANFCEYFSPADPPSPVDRGGADPAGDARAQLAALFGRLRPE